MPAIDLARLKKQSAQLAEKFDQPEAFLRELRDLLDFYTNRTRRAGQTVRPTSLPGYRTPTPVLRQIESELAPLAAERPAETAILADTLWEYGALEMRLLAACLIGQLPVSAAKPLRARLTDWLDQTRDTTLRDALLNDGLAHLRKENIKAFLKLVGDWLNTPVAKKQIWGLHALIPLIVNPRFQNLPIIFSLIRPVVESATPLVQTDLLACLNALERVSPIETVFFLRQVITLSENPQAMRTLRRMLPSFSPETQANLREAFQTPSTR